VDKIEEDKFMPNFQLNTYKIPKNSLSTNFYTDSQAWTDTKMSKHRNIGKENCDIVKLFHFISYRKIDIPRIKLNPLLKTQRN